MQEVIPLDEFSEVGQRSTDATKIKKNVWAVAVRIKQLASRDFLSSLNFKGP